MAESDAHRLKALFDEVADLPHDRRAALLEERCGGDDDLRRRVEALLREDDAMPENYLQAPFTPPLDPGSSFAPGQVIGGMYRLLRVLGEGGMGIVYLAEQAHPQRTVALKVLRAGLSTSAMLRRFEHEVHLLGRLQHPGIAQIFEAATTDTGVGAQPFFVMEYVRGLSILDHAEQNSLGTRDRVKLMIKICEAVQHAHQNRVIHRDLKPGNIMVDSRGQPKILDFGVGRALDDERRMTTVRTDVGQLIGTIPYMSPEQIGGHPETIDTRSDVYSLGVILFEMLSGRLPYEFSRSPIPEAARIIRDESPLRLSAVCRTFRGDLDTITSKALEKDRQRRYGSAAELAADLRRYLMAEPIEARRDSMAYVFRKFLSRHRMATVAAALIMAILLTFYVYAVIQADVKSRLADALQVQLSANNIEQGRLFGQTGNIAAAEEIIWREHLKNPESQHSHWALYELYTRNPSLVTFNSHSRNAWSAAFSPDGEHLVTAGDEGAIRLWETKSFRQVDEFNGHTGQVYAIRFLPSGETLVSAGENGTIILWSYPQGSILSQWNGHEGAIFALDVSPDGARLATGGEDRLLRTWNLPGGVRRRTFAGHEHEIRSVRFSPDGSLIATGSYDRTAKIWSEQSERVLASLSGHDGLVLPVVFTGDNRTLITGSQDRQIRIWETASGQLKSTLTAPNGTIRALLVTPDGRQLISAGWWTVDFWDMASGVRALSLPLRSPAWDICLNPAGNQLSVVSDQGRISVWDLDSDPGMRRLRGHVGRVCSTVDSDGRVILTGDSDGFVSVWEASTGRRRSRFESHSGRIVSMQCDTDGSMLATGGEDRLVRLWDLHTRKLVRTFDRHHSVSIQSIALSPDGQSCALVCSDVIERDANEGVEHEFRNWVELRHIASGELRARTPPTPDEIIAVRYVPERNALVTTNRATVLAMYSLEGELIDTHQSSTVVWTTDLSPNGRLLAAGTWSNDVRLIDVANLKVIRTLKGHKGVVYGVAFHPRNDRFLATASGDGTVKLWDVEQGQALITFMPFEEFDCISVSFSSDGQRLVVSGAHESVAIIDLTYFNRHILGNLALQMDLAMTNGAGETISRQVDDWASVLRSGRSPLDR